MDNLITQLDQYFGKQAPQLPEAFKSLIVQFAPYLIILGALAMIPLILGALGMSAYFGAMGVYGFPGMYYGGFSFMSLLPLLILEILYVMAVPGLLAKKESGWNTLFYLSLANIAYSVLTFNLIGGAIGTIIGWYFLFQVRPYYTGGASVSAPVPPSYNPPVPPPQA